MKITELMESVDEPWFQQGSFETFKNSTPVKYQQATTAGSIQTLEGPVSYAAGYYIMTGPKGEQYPITPQRFKELYDDNGNSTATPQSDQK